MAELQSINAYEYPLYNVQTKKREVLPDEYVTGAIRAGTHSFPKGFAIPVRSPDGESYTMNSDDAVKAVNQGWTVDGPSRIAIDEFLKANEGAGGAAKVFAAQALDEFVFGVPELAASYAADPFTNAKREALKKQHDVFNTLGGISGFAASLFMGPEAWLGQMASRTGGAAAKEAVIKAVGEAIGARIAAKAGGELTEKAAATFGRDLFARMAGTTTEGIIDGAFYSLPQALTEASFGDYEAAADSLLLNTALGGALGGAGSLGSGLLDLGATKTKQFYNFIEGKPLETSDIAKEVASWATDVPVEDIAHVLENRGRLLKEQTPQGLSFWTADKQQIVDAGEGLLSKVQERYRVAQEAYKEARKRTDDARNLELTRIREMDAPESLVERVGNQLDEIKVRLAEGREEMDQGLSDLVETVVYATPLDRLNGLPVFIKNSRIEQKLEELADSMTPSSPFAGRVYGMAIDDQGKTMVRVFEDIRESLASYKKRLSPALQAVEGIDIRFARDLSRKVADLANYNLRSGEFDSQMSRMLKGVSKELNDAIQESLESLVKTKLVPRSERANIKQMAERVQEGWEAQLRRSEALNEAKEFFETPAKAAASLRSLTKENFKGNRVHEVLDRVKTETGEDLWPEIEGFLDAKSLLALNRSKAGGARETLSQMIAPGALADEATKKEALDYLEKQILPFKNWGAKRFQNVIEREGYKRRDVRDPEKLRQLSELANRDEYADIMAELRAVTNSENIDFERIIRDHNALESFDSLRINGSRKVTAYSNAGKVVGSAIGGGIGTAVGGLAGAGVGGIAGGILGGGLGGVAGYGLDRYGGRLLLEVLMNGNNNRALLFAERTLKKTAERLDKSFARMDSLKTLKNEATPRRIRFSAFATIQGLGIEPGMSGEEMFEQLRKKADEIASEHVRMSRAQDIASLIEGNGAPGLGAKVASRLNQQLSYIYEEMPRPARAPNPLQRPSNYRPSDFELKKYGDKIEILDDPLKAIDHLIDGTITPSHIHSLKNNYPAIYQEIQRRIEEKIVGGWDPDLQTRQRLAALFGEDIDQLSSGRAILTAQETFANPNILQFDQSKAKLGQPEQTPLGLPNQGG